MDKWDKQEKENTERKRWLKKMASKKMKEINHMLRRDTTLTEMNKDGSPKITWNQVREFYLLYQAKQLHEREFFTILEEYFNMNNQPTRETNNE